MGVLVAVGDQGDRADRAAAEGVDRPAGIARKDDGAAHQVGPFGLEIDAPQGLVKIDATNHHAELWPRIGRVNKLGKFDVVWESPYRVKPDPYFVAPLLDDWTNERLALKA